MVNAVYHRSYEIREPIEVRITAEELVVLSFPGPDRSIKMDDLRKGRAVSRRYRNRRIGEFLKELDLTEGRSTGISKILKVMAGNGSPAPVFETDEDRTYFLIRLPVHERAATPQDTPQDETSCMTPQIEQLLAVCDGELSREELQERLQLSDRQHFREAYLNAAIDAGFIEMTMPDKPTSMNQRYRRTIMGGDSTQTTPQDTPQATPQDEARRITPQIEQILIACDGEMSRDALQECLNVADIQYFRESYLHPAIEAGLIEMTLPDKPTSKHQRYRLTDAGKRWADRRNR